MSAQKAMNSITGAISGGIIAATQISKGIEQQQEKELKAQEKDAKALEAKQDKASKDMKMAAKARKEAKQKIDAIIANKDISNQARSRRIGKVLDEYKGGK